MKWFRWTVGALIAFVILGGWIILPIALDRNPGLSWIKASGRQLPKTVNEFLAVPQAYRQAVLFALPAEDRARIRREYIDRVLATEKLPPDWQAAIKKFQAIWTNEFSAQLDAENQQIIDWGNSAPADEKRRAVDYPGYAGLAAVQKYNAAQAELVAVIGRENVGIVNPLRGPQLKDPQARNLMDRARLFAVTQLRAYGLAANRPLCSCGCRDSGTACIANNLYCNFCSPDACRCVDELCYMGSGCGGGGEACDCACLSCTPGGH